MRKHNFYAGPSVLPVEVLQELRDEMVDYRGLGLSIIETSHRSDEYDAIHTAALAGIRRLLAVPADYDILLVGGGATMQFSMVPMNLMGGFDCCDYLVSGSWGKKAREEAAKVGDVHTLFDGKTTKYTTLPDAATITASAGSAYLHLTSNETIEGVQWRDFPTTAVPLVADMSSDIMSRPVDVGRFGVIYAGAQKNLGPAGVTIVIIRNDLLARTPATVGTYLRYDTHAKSNSLYNTPPVFAIYAMGKVLAWLEKNGGVEAIERSNTQKAAALYGAIQQYSAMYHCPVQAEYRSNMNVVFTLPNEQLEQRFIAEATAAGMVGLAGHRSIGGVRASLYNSLPQQSVTALVDFMATFAKRNG